MYFSPKLTAVFLAMLVLWSEQACAIELKSKVDPLAQQLIDDGVVVGMVVGIVQGEDSQIFAYGETKKGSRIAPGADSVFEIGSVTKVFTGVLLADAVRSGKVKLDDPIQQYVGESVRVPTKNDDPITLLHLVTHTSGLPRMPSNFHPADPANPYADYDRQQMLEFLGGHKLRRAPGSYEYSNFGAALLGELLADQYKTDYEQAITKRILAPLKMNDTQIKLKEAQQQRFVPGYNAALQAEPAWEFSDMAAAGGIRSTCTDMLRFIRANLANDRQPITLALHDALAKQPQPQEGQRMGLGWHIAGDGVTRWHNGMTGGYHSWLAIVPHRDIGVVVLANTATMRVTNFGEQVTRIAFGANIEPPQKRKEVAVGDDVLKNYVGVYRLAPKFVLDVRLENGKLWVQATGQPKLPVFAESPTEFFYKVVDAQITFVLNEDGSVSKLVLHQNGRDIDGVRESS